MKVVSVCSTLVVKPLENEHVGLDADVSALAGTTPCAMSMTVATGTVRALTLMYMASPVRRSTSTVQAAALSVIAKTVHHPEAAVAIPRHISQEGRLSLVYEDIVRNQPAAPGHEAAE